MKATFVLPFVGLVFVAGCGGSSDTGGAGGASGSAGSGSNGASTSTSTSVSSGGGVSAAQACGDLAKAVCARVDACSNMLGVKLNYPDEATCEQRNAMACEAGLMAPMTGATASGVEACAQAIPGEACGDFLDDNPPAACQPTPGQLADGAPCGAASQCKSAYCGIARGAVCGVCAAPPKAGDSCASAECGLDMVCLRTTMTCAVPIAQGGPCDKDSPCRSGLSCVVPMMGKGSCQPAASKVGDACDPKQQMAPACDRDLGLYCHPLTMKCAAITFAMPGQPCGIINSGETACLAGATCVLSSGQKSGTCVAPAADGAACDAASGPGCLKLARCVSDGGDGGTAGVCRAPDPSACM